MKKLFVMLLLLCMLCGQALAIGDDVVLVEEHAITYRDEDGNLWSVGVYGVENWNEFAVAPVHISVMAMNSAGAPAFYHLLPAESTVADGKATTTLPNDTGADIENGKALFLYRNDQHEVVGAYEMQFSVKKDEVLQVEHIFPHAPFTWVETVAFDPDQHKE